MEFWYIGSGCNRTCRVANINAKVAKMHASMQPENKNYFKHFIQLHIFSKKITDDC